MESVIETELFQSTLDPAELDRLEADLSALAKVIAVIPKAAANAMIDGRTLSLIDGFEQLRNGHLRGLQIRYLHEGSEWWDTLIPKPGGTLLIRRNM